MHRFVRALLFLSLVIALAIPAGSFSGAHAMLPGHHGTDFTDSHGGPAGHHDDAVAIGEAECDGDDDCSGDNILAEFCCAASCHSGVPAIEAGIASLFIGKSARTLCPAAPLKGFGPLALLRPPRA